MAGRDQLRRILEIDRRVRSGTFPHPDSLATELEVARRVIFNDRSYMVDILGAPLAFSRQRRGWYYTEPNWILPTMLITRGELLAFLLAIEAAQRQLGPALESELMASVDKIGRGLRGSIAVDLELLRRHFSFASLPAARAKPETLLELHEAIDRRRVVQMEYFSAHRNQRTRRGVEPHHLYNCSGDWYLFAFDPAKKKMLTFNVARIDNLRATQHTFLRQSDFSADDFLHNGFRAESGSHEYLVAIRFDAAQAPYIRERTWHATQQLEELENGEVIIRLRTSGLGELSRWVMQYGAHAEVLSPLELREIVAAQAMSMASMYGRDGNE